MDKYHGLRVHCWVLVLSGKREVPQAFFIESTTGQSTTLYILTMGVCGYVWLCNRRELFDRLGAISGDRVTVEPS